MSTPSSIPSSAPLPEIVGWRLERRLGRGATAEVYAARSAATPGSGPSAAGGAPIPGEVALKVFDRASAESEDFRFRMRTELGAVRSLEHPHIIRILGEDLAADPAYLVLEFAAEGSLDQLQSRLPYVLPEVSVALLVDVLDGLDHAHARGVLHRDLKPGNLLVTADGRAKISDFGLAKWTDASRQATLTGALLGSPDFMSPEQARGETGGLDERSDLFSLGSVLYFLVTGTRPFQRSNALSTLAAVAEARPEPASQRNPKVSAPLRRLIERALARERSARFASAREFREALVAYLEEVGLGPASGFGFAAWWARPPERSRWALERMADALARRSRAALARGDWEASLGEAARLSLVAPESRAVEEVVSEAASLRERETLGEQRSSRRRRALALSVAILLLGGVGGATYYGRREFARENSSSSAASGAPPLAAVPEAVAEPLPVTVAPVRPTNATIGETSSATSGETSDARAEAPTRVAKKPARAEPGARAKLDEGRVRFDLPANVRVYWDGRPVDPKQGLRDQAPGAHWLRLELPGHPPIVQRIEVRAGEPTVIRGQ